MADLIQTAAENYVAASFAAKQRAASSEEYYEDRESNAAYERLFKAISKVIPKEVWWQWEVSEFTAGSFPETVWHGEIDRETALREFPNNLRNLLDDLSVVEWLACVPLGCEFRRFPKFTDFGPLAVAYVPDDKPKEEAILLAEFREIIAANCGVCFMESAEVRQSYFKLAGPYYGRSDCYVPGRPQMVLNAGRGESRSNERIVRERLRQILPLFQLCQVIASPPLGRGIRFIDERSGYMPDRTSRMPLGLIEIPDCALAINRRTGECDWWQDVRPFKVYEASWDGVEHDPERFQLVWNNHIKPILKLHDNGLIGPVRKSVDSAVELVGSSRHAHFGKLLLNCVIATETILNPFNTLGELSERFALLSAALVASNPEARKLTYDLAKKLYRLRCHAVHRSQNDNEDRTLEGKALELFLGCLGSVVRWADESLLAGRACGKEAFDDFYVRSIFSR